MPINDKVLQLYNAMKADGADVGTEQEFNDYFMAKGDQGYKNRKAVWDAFKADGADVGENYEEFAGWLGLKPVKTANGMGAGVGAALGKPSPVQPKQPQQPTTQPAPQGGYQPTWQEQWAADITTNRAEDAAINAPQPIVQQQANQQTYQQHVNKQAASLGRQGRVVEDDGSYITEDATRHNVLVDANKAQKQIQRDISAMNMAGMDQQIQGLLEERERLQSELDNTPADWVDQDGRVHQASEADKQRRASLEKELEANKQEVMGLANTEWYRNRREEQGRSSLEDIDRQMEQLGIRREKAEKDKSFFDKVSDVVSNITHPLSAFGLLPTQQEILEHAGYRGKELQEISKEENILGHRRDLTQEGLALLDELRTERNGGLGNLGLATAGRNVWNTAAKRNTWDFGAHELDRELTIAQAIMKQDNGQELTPNEKALLNDWAYNSAVSSQYSDQLSGWAKAGMVTGESLPFMLEMALNPMSGLGKSTTDKLVKYAVKRYGTKWVRDHMKGLVASKIATRAAADIAGSYGMATTTGIARTAADAVRRMKGEVDVDMDDKGDIIYKGVKQDTKENPAAAIFKALNNTAIEDWSEMAGNYFGFVNNFFGNVLGKAVVGKAGRKMLNATGGIEGVTLNKAQKFIYELAAGKGIGAFSEGLAQFAKKTQWHGVVNEYLEEVIGNVVKATPLVGDMTFDTAENTGVFNLQQNIDTFCGVALMGGFMSALHTAGYAAHKVNYDLDKVNEANSKLFGEDLWGDIKMMIDNSYTDPRELNNALTYVLRGDSGKQYSPEEKKAVLKYTQALLEKEGAEMVDYKPNMASSTIQEVKGEDGKKQWQVTSLDVNGDAITQQSFDNEDDAKAFETELKMQQQKKDYNDYLSMSTKLSFGEVNNAIDEFLGAIGVNQDSEGYEEVLADINNPNSRLGKEFQEFKFGKVIEKAKASQAAIAQFEEENGWAPGTVKWLAEQDPMQLDREGLQMQDQARAFLESLAYPAGEVHVEHEQKVGAEAGQQVVEQVVSTEEPIDPMNNIGKDIQDQWDAAQASRQAAFDNDERLKEEVERMEGMGLSPQEIISSLDWARPEQRQAMVDYYNAQAKYNSMVNAAANKINEEAAKSRQRNTFKGTINGAADLNNVYQITDGTNTYTLVSGNVTTNPATGEITDSTSGLIIGLDSNGEFVQLGDSEGYSVVQTGLTLDQFEEAERLRLQEETTTVIMPNGPQIQPQQEEQQTGEVGGEAGVANDTGANEPLTPESVPENPEEVAQQPAQIPVDEKTGVKMYEQGVPVDDAIKDMEADGLDVNEESDLAINEAQEELDKLGQPKTRAERVKNDARRKELQNIIDYYNNVKKRYAELHPQYADAAPFIAQMNAATSKKKADEILNAALQAGVNPAEINPVHTQKVSDLITKEEEKRKADDEITDRDRQLIRQYKDTPEGRAYLLDRKRVPSAEKRRKIAALIYGDNFDNDFEAWRDLRELISSWLGKGRALDPDSFGQALGWDMGVGKDAAKVSTMFTAKRENGGDGMTWDAFVHQVMESSEGRFDTEEVSRMLEDMFRGAIDKYDLTEYQLLTRIAEAEAKLQGEEQQAAEAAESGEQFVENEPINDGGLPFGPQPEGEERPAFLGEEEEPAETKQETEGSENEESSQLSENPIEAIEQAAESFKQEQEEKQNNAKEAEENVNVSEEENNEEENVVTSQTEEPFTLTLEALEASDLDESIKSGARAWLNGDKSQGNQFAFLIAQDYVRDFNGNNQRSGQDADSTQLGSENNGDREPGGTGLQGGSGEHVDSGNNGEGVSELGTGGENSQGNVASGDGTGGNRGISGGTPGQDESPVSDGSVDSGLRGKKGSNGRRGGRRGSSSVSKGNARVEKSASARADLDAAIQEFEDVLKESITDPIKGKLLAADPISLYAYLGGRKAIKVLTAGTKVAYAAIRLGYYEFKDWMEMMKSKLGDPLRNIAAMDDEQIDGFIEMLWDYDLTIDGETHKVREWATLMSEEELREQMAMTIEQKRKLQKDAEKTPTILENITNIRESLPFLLPKQQEDVQKAEKQFFNESHSDAKHGHGKGYMFTNGTGTGKTYTGLGIVKRFLKQGKGRILIVTASDKKIQDWIKDAKNLGIEATMLPDTKSKGTGVVVTQYANIRQNRALLEDAFDLIVYDESHKLMENQDGMPTSTSIAHHMLANRDVRQGARRLLMAGELGKELEEAKQEYELLQEAMNLPTNKWSPEVKEAYKKAGGTRGAVEEAFEKYKYVVEHLEEVMEEKVDEMLANPEKRKEIEEAVKKTKVVFLSATPFNTPANLDYSEGYIFSYTNTDDVLKEEARLAKRDSFLLENFNTSHVRSPKTRMVSRISQERISDPMKASEEEVAFSDKLQGELETMSGRDLDSEYDYSREFPKLDFPMATVFNDAIQSLSDGRFNPLRKYFDHLLDDYTTMTGYLEIFKAQMIAPRIREYIDLGKKVTLYHRRKASNATMYPPFAEAMEKARAEADGDPKMLSAIEAFERTYANLFQWESSIDYMFPQDSILREFMTPQEKETYENELKKWTDENGSKLQRLQEERMVYNMMLQAAINKGDNGQIADLMDKVKQKSAEIEKLIKTRPKAKSAMVVVFNGSETEKARREAVDKFNDDNSPVKVFVAQVQSAKEGISLHDTTGKYPRVQIGIFLPQSPIEFIQTEGRIFRVGNKSNAIFEYPLLGLDIELSNFAQKINGRSETTENLALGKRGRGLKDSISRAALASRHISPSDAKGIGGKELDDKKAQQADDFDAAMKNYAEWRQDEKPTDINEIEIPDPIGYIMTKLANSENGERVLVPNARRGSVARYVPGKSRLTALEERNKDFARLSALIGGSGRKVLNEPFTEHSRVNKYDIVVLNTSHGKIVDREQLDFGNLNATSLDARDVIKACKHIDDSGRVVAIVDSSKVSEIRSAAIVEHCVLVSEVKLPDFVMGGTPCSIVVLDKIDNKKKRDAVGSPSVVDLTSTKNEDDLFNEIRNVVAPDRNIDAIGRVGRKLRSVVTPFENTGCVAKEKNYRTGKMEPRIYIEDGRLYVKFNNSKMVWMASDGRTYRAFDIDYGLLAKGEPFEMRVRAEDWVLLNQQLNMSDEELKNTYRRFLGYRTDVDSVRDCLRVMMQSIEIALGKTPMQINNLAQGKVENEVSGEYNLSEFRQVFDSLNSGNAELEALADRVFDAVSHIDGLQFKVMPGETFRSSGGHNVVAHYVPSRNIIELNGDIFNSVRYGDDFKAQTIVHEMIHALTSWALETYDNYNTRSKLTQEQQEACKIIKDVYSQINNDDFRRQLRLNSTIDDNAEYGLTNEHEMMAELSNPVFRAALKAKKLWNQLVNGVKMLLGIQLPGTEAEETNALDALDHALETLMNSYNPELYSAFTQNLNSEVRANVSRQKDVIEPNSMITTSDPMKAIKQAAESWSDEQEHYTLEEAQKVVDELSKKYKSQAPISVVRSDADDITLVSAFFSQRLIDAAIASGRQDQIKKIAENLRKSIDKDVSGKNAGGYIDFLGKIVIFADRLQKERYEEAFFHENIHAKLSEVYGETDENDVTPKRDIAEKLWKRVPDSDSLKKRVIKRYKDESDRPEELFAYMLSNCMVKGDFSEIEKYLDESDKELLNNILNDLGYDRTREEKERRGSLGETKEGNSQDESRQVRGLNSETEADELTDPIKAIEFAAKKFKGIQEDMSEARKSVKQQYTETLDKEAYVWTEAWQDSMLALKVFQNAALKEGEQIADSQNAYMFENLMHGKNRNEMDLFNAEYRDPLMETVMKIASKMVWSMRDMNQYLLTKSGLERNRELYVRDWLEKKRKEEDADLDELKNLENKWNALKQELYDKLQRGEIAYADYLEEMRQFIRANMNRKYDPSKHDYSGLTEMYGDEKGNYDEDDIIAKLTEDEKAIGDQPSELVDKLWQQINSANRYALERYREAGMRSDAEIDRIESMFNFYVPMRGFEMETGEDMYQYFTSKANANSYVGGLIKHAKGRESMAKSPLSTMFGMSYKAINDCNQNLMLQRFYLFCQAHPNDLTVLGDAWVKWDDVKEEWVETWPEIPDDATDEQARQAMLDYEDEMRQLSRDGKAKKIRGKAEFDYKPIDKKHKSEHTVEVRINGEKKLITIVGNPRLAQALNGHTRWENGRNIVSKVNANIKNMMSSAFTSYSPTFAARNMMRDWTHFRMMLSVREGEGYAHAAAKYYKETFPRPWHGKGKVGMVKLFKKYRKGTLDMSNEVERDFKDFMDNGGVTGYVQMQKIDKMEKELKKLIGDRSDAQNAADKAKYWLIDNLHLQGAINVTDKVWNAVIGLVEAYNEAVENNARFATYRASRHYAGRTKARSAYDAKEITVNFNRKGSGAKARNLKNSKGEVSLAAETAGLTSQVIGEGRIFNNATVQAIATTFKNFQNPDGSLNWPYIRKWAARYATPPFMFGLALPYINMALAAMIDGGDGDDDNPYANLPEWTRRKNLCIYVGDNSFITLPIGQELAAFLTLGDIMAGMTYESDLRPVDKDWVDEMRGVLDTFSPIDLDTKVTNKEGLAGAGANVTARLSSVLAPIVAVGENLGWTGRPIYKEDKYANDEFKPEYQQVYQSTNPLLVKASKKLHEIGGGNDRARGKNWSEVNPAVVQYLWEQYTGGPGKLFSNTISLGKDAGDMAGQLLRGEPIDTDFNMRKVEGLKAFISQGDDRTEYYRAQSKFYKYERDANKFKYDHDLTNLEKQAKEKDPAAKMELDALKKTKEYARYEIIRDANHSDKKKGKVGLDEQRKEINKTTDRKEKREKQRVYNTLMKQTVDKIDELNETE